MNKCIPKENFILTVNDDISLKFSTTQHFVSIKKKDKVIISSDLITLTITDETYKQKFKELN